MRKIVRIAIGLVFSLLVLYPVAWILASVGLLGEVEFGYYKEFNVAKHAIEKSGCAEVIEYSGVNKDTVLEEFHFKVTTRSGPVVRLWFDASNMDVSQLCYAPVGLVVRHPEHEDAQVYTLGMLSNLAREKNFQVTGLRDILCNIDELEKLFKTNYGDANAILAVDPYSWDYLRIEFPTEEGLKPWKYTDVKEKDVHNWP